MMKSKELTEEIKKFLLDEGADLVGVAPISRFAECPEETHPQHYMPDATCVISFGMKLLDEVCDVWGDYSQPHKSASPYLYYGYGLVNYRMSWIGYLAAKRILEFQGYKALLFPPTFTVSQYRFMERVIEEYPQMLADFSHRHTAVAAGLGEFGFNGLVLVPKFGARIRFNSIITNAPLEPDPMYQGTPLCLPEKCNYKCVQDCPTEALTLDETFTVKIGQQLYKYSKLDKMRCNMSIFGLVRGSGGRTRRKLPPRAKKKITAADYLKAYQQVNPIDKFFLNERPLVTGDFCGKCLHGCVAHKLWKKSE